MPKSAKHYPKDNTKEQNRQVLKDKLLVELEKNAGLIAVSCKNLGISTTTFYDFRDSDPVFKEKFIMLLEIWKDWVESQLFKQIKEGNPAQTQFWLKKKAKDRGYGDDNIVHQQGKEAQF